jgi:hypothetical protein
MYNSSPSGKRSLRRGCWQWNMNLERSASSVSLFFSRKPSTLYVTEPAKCLILQKKNTKNCVSRGVADPGSGIWCLFSPWIRDPEWKKTGSGIRDPGSGMIIADYISESLGNNFLGYNYLNSLMRIWINRKSVKKFLSVPAYDKLESLVPGR